MLLGRVGQGAFEIGYWTDRHATGQGFATEAACALVRVAFEIEQADRLEIHCEPDNAASAAIPARLGFTHDATLAAKTTMQAFDCLDDPII